MTGVEAFVKGAFGALSQKPILVFDFETDGLTMHPDAPIELQPRAIEFGGIYLDPLTGDVLSNFEFFINPERAISPEITKITGITNDMLAGQPTWIQQAPLLASIFDGASCSVAHNHPFDKAIVKYENARCPSPTPCPLPQLPEKQFCTIELYRQAWGKDMKLTALYEAVVGRKLEQRHRGLADVVALADIIRADKLHELMRQ